LNLDVRTTGFLYKGITQIEAQDMLSQFEVACYPYIKEKMDRARLYKKYHRLAYPVKRKAMSTAEMATELRTMLGG
jgi:hypothetical protein